MGRLAITRGVSPNLGSCELTHLTREEIDPALAVAQHRQYEQALVDLGCRLFALPGDPEMPDCVFIEDIAIVFDELAIITRPGAASRRAEIPVVRSTLGPFRRLTEIHEPGLLDGGDVLRVGKTVFVGLSTRTNQAALEQLEQILEPLGYRVRAIGFGSCLHLKSAVTQVADRTLLIQPDWVSPKCFPGLELIPVDPSEPHGGNALQIGGTVLYSGAYDRTRERMEAHGLTVRTVDQSELAKAEGGVTCCSLIFEQREK